MDSVGQQQLLPHLKSFSKESVEQAQVSTEKASNEKQLCANCSFKLTDNANGAHQQPASIHVHHHHHHSISPSPKISNNQQQVNINIITIQYQNQQPPSGMVDTLQNESSSQVNEDFTQAIKDQNSSSFKNNIHVNLKPNNKQNALNLMQRYKDNQIKPYTANNIVENYDPYNKDFSQSAAAVIGDNRLNHNNKYKNNNNVKLQPISKQTKINIQSEDSKFLGGLQNSEYIDESNTRMNLHLLNSISESPDNLQNNHGESYAIDNREGYPMSNTLVHFDRLAISHILANQKVRSQSNSFYHTQSARQKWLKLQNVFRGINLMKKNIVKKLVDPDEIVDNINNSPRRKRKLPSVSGISSFDVTRIALDDLRQQDRFFELIQKGGTKDIPSLQRELDRDPKKHFYDTSNPNHLINKVNRFNQTPLYLACRNGNLGVVTFFLEQQADPHILSNINEEDKESPLEVAARWNHQSVVRFLLKNVAWTEYEVKKTIEIEDLNPQIMRMLKDYSKRRFNCFFNFCLCK